MKHRYLTAAAAIAVMGLGACGGESATANEETANVEAEEGGWAETVTKTEEGGYLMGNPDAEVQVVEFASLTCSHCRDFAEQSAGGLEEFVATGDVSFELRNFVRDPYDLTMALLVRCGNEDAFFQRSERMFANLDTFGETLGQADQAEMQARLTPQAAESGEAFTIVAEAGGLIDFIGGLGVPEQEARQCLTNTELRDELVGMRDAAIAQYNLQGTPTFLINGEVASGVSNWPQLEARLREMTQ